MTLRRDLSTVAVLRVFVIRQFRPLTDLEPNRPRGQQETCNSHDLRRLFKEDDQEITRRPNDGRDAIHPESAFPSISEVSPRFPQASAGWLASVLHQYPGEGEPRCNRPRIRKPHLEGVFPRKTQNGPNILA